VLDLKKLDIAVRNLKSTGARYERHFGGGLSVVVSASTGLKTWYFIQKISGRGVRVKLGVYPHTTAKDAHEAMVMERSRVRGGFFYVLSISQARGLNVYSHVSEVWVIGRPGIPARQAIRYAAAILKEPIEIEDVDHATGAYWMTDGSMVPAPGQEVLSHPVAQMVFEWLTAAEVYQALNRARPTIRANDDIEIVIFTRTAIPWLQIDHLIHREPLREWGNPLRGMLLEVVPDVSGGGSKYGLLGHLMGATEANITDRFYSSKDADGRNADRDALDEMVAMGQDGTLSRLGWGRFEVTLGRPKSSSSKATLKLLNNRTYNLWVNCDPGDTERAKAVLTGLDGVVVSIKALEPPEQGVAAARWGSGEAEINSRSLSSGDSEEACDIGNASKGYILENPMPVPLQTSEVRVSGNYSGSDLLECLKAAGVLPVPGAKGFAEVIELVTALKAESVLNKLSKDPALKAALAAEVARGGVTHTVRLRGGRYGVPCHLTPEAVDALRALDCTVTEAGGKTPPDGAPKRRVRPRKNPPPQTTAPPLTVQYFTDAAAARVAHMQMVARRLAELIASGSNDLEMIGFKEGEAAELLAMAREIANRAKSNAEGPS
jgi:hypothetical protein